VHIKRDEQREHLLQAAYELVKEVGVSGLRTRDIADRAGVNVATLHYCFESKDGLLAALYDYILTQVCAERERYLSGAVGPEQKLRATSAMRLHFLHNRPASVQAWRAFAEGVWTSEVVRNIMRRHFAEQRTRMGAIIAEGRALGVIGPLPTQDDELMASIMMGLYDGLIFQWAADPDTFPIDEYESVVLSWLGLADKTENEGG
jgi:AcrR family transcriptional regulator